jgi:hypothetical protein
MLSAQHKKQQQQEQQQQGSLRVSGIERLLFVACAIKKKLSDHQLELQAALSGGEGSSSEGQHNKQENKHNNGKNKGRTLKKFDHFVSHKQLGALLESTGLIQLVRTVEKRAHSMVTWCME